MKKIILLTILMIIPIYSFGAWGTSVKAVWLLENNLNDSSGNSNTAETNSSATPVYSNTIKKEGTYSIYTTSYNTAINTGYGVTSPPASTLTADIASNTIGIWAEAWVYDMGSSARHIFGIEGWQFPTLMLSTDGTNAICAWNNVAVNIGNYNVTTEKKTWIHWAYTYDVPNNTLKIYKNGSLIYTRNSASHDPLGNATYPRALLFGMSWNQPSYAYFDRVIVGVGAVPETFPTDPLVDTTPTITETITQTITATITQTVTETITKTVTQTITETITQTITETITPTITQTSTITTTITRTATATATTTRRPYPSITPTRTMTPRGTPKAIWTYKSPTPTRTPYIRVLSTPRARYATVTPTPTLYWW